MLSVARTGVALAVAMMLGGLVACQDSNSALVTPEKHPGEGPTTISTLLALRGQEISRGTNQQATGRLGLLTYRLERLTPPTPLNTQLNGRAVSLSRVHRFTITGGPFTPRAMPYAIWLDDDLVGVGQESSDLSAIAAILIDESQLRSGRLIRVSAGVDPEAEKLELPEPLTLRTNQ